MLATVDYSDRYREEASDSMERMKPEEVYDSIRRTTADIRHYVKKELNTASPPSLRTGVPSAQRRDTRNGSSDRAAAESYHLPVVRSPDVRSQQRYNQVTWSHVSVSSTRSLPSGQTTSSALLVSYDYAVASSSSSSSSSSSVV